jgi:hypothetical protein
MPHQNDESELTFADAMSFFPNVFISGKTSLPGGGQSSFMNGPAE